MTDWHRQQAAQTASLARETIERQYREQRRRAGLPIEGQQLTIDDAIGGDQK